MPALTNRQLFPLTREISYLDTAAEGLPPLGPRLDLAHYWREKSKGTPGRVRLYEKQRETEEAAARLLGTSADNVAFLVIVGSIESACELH